MGLFKKPKKEERTIGGLLSKKQYHLSNEAIPFQRSKEKKEKKIDDNLKLILIGGGIFLLIVIVLGVVMLGSRSSTHEPIIDDEPSEECLSDFHCDDNEFSTKNECINEVCVYTEITECIHSDNYCPDGCYSDSDIDCEGSEECRWDYDCNDEDASTSDTCDPATKQCLHSKISNCTDYDNYCPTGCSFENDNDCSAGDECSVDFDCNDNDASTKDECTGTPQKCSHITITVCEGLDGYCPPGCTMVDDVDCDETSCLDDKDCDDNEASSLDECKGEPKKCVHTKIIQCKSLDEYCPPGCNYNIDKDCDPEHACSTDDECDDNKPSTADICDDNEPQRFCRHENITECIHADNYCVPGCSFEDDNDCVDPNEPIKQGTFSGVGSVDVYGDVKILNITGLLTLNLGANFHTDTAPNTRIYLVKKTNVVSSADLDVGFADMGILKNREGSQSYNLPSTLDISKFHSVALYTTTFGTVLGSADIA